MTGDLWKTTADLNDVKTLYEGHDERGRPQWITEGWEDSNNNGAIDGAEFSLRRREFTYHATLDAPLTVTQKSLLNPAANRVETSVYDPSTDRLSARRSSAFTLDATGAVIPFLDETTFSYDSNGRLSGISGPRPAQHTEIDYDPTSGSRSALRRYLNGSTSASLAWAFADFDARGNPQTVTDPNDRTTTFTYDGLGRVLTATPPYEGTGSTTVTFTYDLDGNLTRVDFPPDSASNDVFLRLGYDPQKPGLLRFIADSQGNAIVYTYALGRATREERYTGFVSLTSLGTRVGDATFSYNAAGRLLRAFNPLFGSGTVYSEFDHDAEGNPTDIQDENGKQDELVYDALDRLEKISQFRTATYETEFTYDALSNVTSVTDAAGKTTDLLHDDRGNLVETFSPDTGRTRFLYDAAGNLATKIEDAPAPGSTGGRVTTYTYDGLNRLTSINLSNDPDWTFTYDTSASINTKGRLASVTNGTITTEFGYTRRGDVLYERLLIAGSTYSTNYDYDAAGNRITIVPPDDTQIGTQYAGLRPSGITLSGEVQRVREIEWYPFGPWKSAKFPSYDVTSGENTVVSERDFNLRGQITRIHVHKDAIDLLDRSYSYDLRGLNTNEPNDPGPNLDEIADALDTTESRFFFYDSLDRLAKATNLTGAALHDYSYDAVGNRQTTIGPAGSTSYTYEPGKNRIDGASGADPRDYAHDAYGNRIYDGAAAYTGTPSLIYDDSNRLIRVLDPTTSGVVAEYKYDAFGRRVYKLDWAAAKTYFYVYDTAGHLLQEIEKKANAPDRARTYVYLEDDLVGLVDRVQEVGSVALWPSFSFDARDLRSPMFAFALIACGGTLLLLIARRHPARAKTVTGVLLAVFTCAGTQRPPPTYSWVHTDPLGTPLAVTSAPQYSASEVIWRAKYEPFGKATPNEDPDGDSATFKLNVRFPGQYEDEETGWHYNMARTYDPATGRYLEPDPLGLRAGINLYSYAAGNPERFIDPDGRDLIEWVEGAWAVGPLDAARGGFKTPKQLRDFFGLPPLTARDTAVAAGLGTSPYPVPQNAVQHCVWACELAKGLGADKAKEVLEIHERAGQRNPIPQPLAERQMDEANNRAGLECDELDPDRNCALACRERLRDGRLFGPGGQALPPLPVTELPTPGPSFY